MFLDVLRRFLASLRDLNNVGSMSDGVDCAATASVKGCVTVLPRSFALRCLTIMHEACDRTRESYQGRHADPNFMSQRALLRI